MVDLTVSLAAVDGLTVAVLLVLTPVLTSLLAEG
jgi:hypothetical protein